MKAACVRTQGPASNIRLEEWPTPQPGQGEVLVRVTWSALNPIDVYLRAGTIPMPVPSPLFQAVILPGWWRRSAQG